MKHLTPFGIILILCVLVEFVVILLLFGPGESSHVIDKDTVVREFEADAEQYQASAEELAQYEAGDVFRIAGSKETLATMEAEQPIKMGDVFVLRNAGAEEGKEDLPFKYVSSGGPIDYALRNHSISEIVVNDSNIQYCGNWRNSPVKGGFWGFYYSFDGAPQIVNVYHSGPLEKDGSGWSCSQKDSMEYYTEKITGDFYYYEGSE